MTSNQALIQAEAAFVSDGKRNLKGRYVAHEDGIAVGADGLREPCTTTDEFYDQLEPARTFNNPDRAFTSQELKEFIRTLLGPTTGDINRSTIGTRVIALAWCLDPSLIDGAPSLRKLAARCGIKAPNFCQHTTFWREQFGLCNRAQASHDHHRMVYAEQNEPEPTEADDHEDTHEDIT